jgi:enamine deaminase RidA (YjgF/YER057c/UK114 family)
LTLPHFGGSIDDRPKAIDQPLQRANPDEEEMSMAVKTAVKNERAPDLGSVFNWGVSVTDFDELLLLAGRGDVDAAGSIRNPDDPVAQTVAILAEQKGLIEDNGYSVSDVIRIEFTMAKEVDRSQQQAIFAKFAEFFADVDVRPAAGTLRVVDRLAYPGMLVEFEFWLAR